MDLAAFLTATLIAHVGFATFVTGHARVTDRNAGNWPYLTLALGIAGVAGYFFYDESPSVAAASRYRSEQRLERRRTRTEAETNANSSEREPKSVKTT